MHHCGSNFAARIPCEIIPRRKHGETMRADFSLDQKDRREDTSMMLFFQNTCAQLGLFAIVVWESVAETPFDGVVAGEKSLIRSTYLYDDCDFGSFALDCFRYDGDVFLLM